MDPIDKFVEAKNLSLPERTKDGTFQVDYAIRDIGPDADPVYEIWRRYQGQKPVRLPKVHDSYPAAHGWAEKDLGKVIKDGAWKEGDPGDWGI